MLVHRAFEDGIFESRNVVVQIFEMSFRVTEFPKHEGPNLKNDSHSRLNFVSV